MFHVAELNDIQTTKNAVSQSAVFVETFDKTGLIFTMREIVQLHKSWDKDIECVCVCVGVHVLSCWRYIYSLKYLLFSKLDKLAVKDCRRQPWKWISGGLWGGNCWYGHWQLAAAAAAVWPRHSHYWLLWYVAACSSFIRRQHVGFYPSVLWCCWFGDRKGIRSVKVLPQQFSRVTVRYRPDLE